MNHRWLRLLLILSLAGNMVELGVFAYRRLKYWYEMQGFFSRLADGTSQVDLNVLGSWREAEFESLSVADLRLERELQVARGAAKDSAGLDPIVAQMARVAREQYRLAFESRRALGASADSTKRRSLELRWRRMTGIAQPPR